MRGPEGLRFSALLSGAFCLTGVTLFVAAASRVPNEATGTPVWPPGHWKTVIVYATFGAFVAYAAGLLLIAHAHVSGRAVIAIAIAIQLMPLTGPLLLSNDARKYVAFARAPDPYLGSNPTNYGPLWSMISIPVSRIGDGVYAMRVLAAVASLGLVALAWRLASRKALAAAFVGWNPFVALNEAGGGHNDALMMVAVLAALVLATRGSRTLAGAAWAASVAVKWSSAPLYFLWAVAERRRHREAGLAGALIFSGLVVAAAFLTFGSGWLHVFSNLSGLSNSTLPTQLGFRAWLHGLGVSDGRSLQAMKALELGLLGVFTFAAWRGRLRLGLAATLFALSIPYMDLWYVIWGIALSAADDDDRWGRVLAVAVTGYVLADAVTTYVEVSLA